MTASTPISDSISWLDSTWSDIIKKVETTSQSIGPRFPSMTKDGVYGYTDVDAWTTGFWPGILWLLYEDTKNESFRSIAEACEDKLDEAIDDFFGLTHDIGFSWQLTAMKNHALTGNELSRKRAIVIASHLAGRFNIKGNFIRAWNTNDVNEANPQGLSIIDCTMNLPILFFAARENDCPHFEHIARAHADTVVKEFIREDGSVNHMVEFEPYTGEKLRVHGGQGESPNSAWSRGTSWALHGMAELYTLTRDKRYLESAKKVADFFIRELPEDSVPHWDFRVERTDTTARDSSAAACASCGLLELSTHVEGREKQRYLNAATAMLKSLYQKYSVMDDDQQQGLLRGGTFNHPQGLGINISLIYGDYYFTEGISRLLRLVR
ncbi:glycoside hydrolase family 88 protein [Pelagicoccus enzymogenes]|uniref:glycoside hydrolase family 88 protein n=1 Tax=Pelagicoccus enzymogenes TaxID=2773457 RepID=UPI00280D308B|nr:glycoside hydrolase family 88 protein [Pelagicoccus enzymogenes]MDQ8201264.1 glycoside hydrolase family 88 protein [Pelagicoccus enzymogenes]